MLAILVAHLPGLDVGMPAGDVAAALERQPEQLVGGVERGLDDMMELEVGLDLALVDIALPLAQLFGVVAPVPGRELEIAALLLNQRLHGIAVDERARACRLPPPLEQITHCLRRLRHRVVEPVVRKAPITEEPRALGAQRENFRDDRLVVGLAAAVAACDPGAEDLLAQIAARGEL